MDTELESLERAVEPMMDMIPLVMDCNEGTLVDVQRAAMWIKRGWQSPSGYSLHGLIDQRIKELRRAP